MIYTPELAQVIKEIKPLVSPSDRKELIEVDTIGSLKQLLNAFFRDYEDEGLREKTTWAIYLLEKIGMQPASSQQVPPNKDKVVEGKKMYRGQVILDERSPAAKSDDKQPSQPKKKPRMYRGQIVRD